ncbi:hypothetical protein [Nocardioides sp.]|uniref:hypothetical protein n=1 Tax=Nocardioides sp. TaxID=35761 RepID=UPI002B26F246|nr:hypothetical protein [Nocardioides sp.]
MRRRRASGRRAAAASLAAGVLVSALVGCSAGESLSSSETVEAAPTTTPEPAPLATVSVIGRVDGALAKSDRGPLRIRVTSAVDRWIDAAYSGDYPRSDFSNAFASFTKEARGRARQDAALLSNSGIGPRLETVVPVQRRVVLDVLAVKGRAVGVTAKVRLAFDLTGPLTDDRTRTDLVTGSLFLTFDKSGGAAGWRAFGYDLTRKES